MKLDDVVRATGRTLAAYRLRAGLTLSAMAIGVASVIVLTALGDGARVYVINEFASLGTHLLVVLPGRSETVGTAPPVLGETPRDLTLEDALALHRSSAVRRIAPVQVGVAPVSWRNREREATVLGSTDDMRIVRHLELTRGRFLPEIDPRHQAPVCVIGSTIKESLFSGTSALGQWVRIGDRRFRVIGILAKGGESLGVDLGEVVIVPVASAQSMFNTESLFRIMVEARSRESIDRAEREIREIIKQRHEGEDDITIITQDAVLSTFDQILTALTYGVAGIASISLVVAGVLVMNVMLISVTERTAEIGLLKAIGGTPRQILTLFLAEAAALSLTGGSIGLAIGYSGAWLVGEVYPALPISPPLWSVFASLGTALSTGIAFGVVPARRAAKLDPIRALARR